MANNSYIGRKVVLVDTNDREVGIEEIFSAHANPGKLHRAISVLLWRKRDGLVELLIQQRSTRKPLWPTYWANTVCTHPYPNEPILDCAYRRLKEEVGIVYTGLLYEKFSFIYQADYSSELSEHEYDHVIIGEYDGAVIPNVEEVMAYKWIGIQELKDDIQARPNIYSPWIKLIAYDIRLDL